jgi:hypothetical protein
MSDPEVEVPLKRGLPLDVYAVLLSLAVALLVRLNLIPPVKW